MRGVKIVLKSALFFLVLIPLVGCDEQIVHDLTEFEANRIVSRFSETELNPRKVQQSDGRWAIAVSRNQAVPALKLLESQRILSPKSITPATKGRGAIIPSREEQRFGYQRAMAQSIEESLNTLGGVLEAHVHLNLPESDPLLGRTREDAGSGSVLLLVDDHLVIKSEEISALVGGAAGIPAANVTVLRSVAEQRDPERKQLESVADESGVKLTDRAASSPADEASWLTALEIPTFVFSTWRLWAAALVFGSVLMVFRRFRRGRARAPRFPLPKELVDES